MFDPFILVILVALVLVALVIGIIALIFFGIKHSKEKTQSFKVLAVSSEGFPMGGVDVKFGDKISVTDSYGKANFEIQPGEYELLIIADGHSEFRQKVRTGDRKLYSAKLSKEVLRPEMKQLENAISLARSAREEIGASYNPTIPDYMFNICLAMHKMALDEARAQSDGKLRSESLKSTVFAISQVSKGMVERRNLALYANAKGKRTHATELPIPSTPDIFTARAKLVQVDILITKQAGKSAISPPLVLWKTAQKLLFTPSVFNIKLATFLLDSAEKMVIELYDYLT